MKTMTYSPDLIPCALYTDVHEGIAYLKRTLGFEEHLLVPNPDGSFAHVEMRLGRAIVMCEQSGRADADFHGTAPSQLGGKTTVGIYVAAPDVEQLFARARDAGAVFFDELHDTDYGSRDFSIVDPSGNRWGFGTYHPLAEVEGDTNPGAGYPPEAFAARRYDDALGAIRFLRDAFGFKEHFLVADGEMVHHAQVSYGSSVFMLGSSRDDRHVSYRPDQLGGYSTGYVYAIVDDIDAHAERARKAGATIVKPPYDSEHGSRDYSALDPEGHLWFFGTYRPERSAL